MAFSDPNREDTCAHAGLGAVFLWKSGRFSF